MQSPLDVIHEQIETAASLAKCHSCGCFQQTTEALALTAPGRDVLSDLLGRARDNFTAKKYDCLGCAICYPAIAANAFAEAYPEQSESLDLCPTEMPEERAGWPPLPGEYQVSRYTAPVAVVTLNSEDLAEKLRAANPEGMAVVGPMHTENLGIERVIQNALGNPNIRFLLVCGDDTQQAVGHLPGQSMESLFKHGVDDGMRIREAKGKRPYLKNVSREQVQFFLEQVELISLIGTTDVAAIAEQVKACAARNPGPFEKQIKTTKVEVVRAPETERFVTDAAGFFVIYPDSKRKLLLVEHYTPTGVLDCIIEGETPTAIYMQSIEKNFVSRLDHAAYLGRELDRAYNSLVTGEAYVQDRVPYPVQQPQRRLWL
ncbi:MAG: DUF4346 domain-containing protein [Candidatus Melainabacteria bacterium]|jgi:tetrahydromethanopterin S-methyltransferase subunit A|nr:DUF4346 domain-containing protein [Candidatus Melainabacteria bacterium]RTL37219.1 MAG: DUF4346 domain-containing protein [Candidatus Melainabacteria bacterium]